MENNKAKKGSKICSDCLKEIHLDAKKCPYCQTDFRWYGERHPIITTFLTIFIFITIYGWINIATSSQTNNKTNSSQTSSLFDTLPSNDDVFNRTESIIKKHLTDIDNSITNANNSTSFDQCMKIESTIRNEICSSFNMSCDSSGIGHPSFFLTYKKSNILLAEIINPVLKACTKKWMTSLLKN